jgi:hypothetical protein
VFGRSFLKRAERRPGVEAARPHPVSLLYPCSALRRGHQQGEAGGLGLSLSRLLGAESVALAAATASAVAASAVAASAVAAVATVATAAAIVGIDGPYPDWLFLDLERQIELRHAIWHQLLIRVL